MKTYLLLTLALLTANLSAQNGETTLRPNEKIMISIGGVPADEVMQISKVYSISDSGKINLLHIGEVSAVGMKPSALQKRIEDAYKSAQIYTHPTVTVAMDSSTTGAQLVFVNGGCQRNGPVQFRSGMTLSMAIGMAGSPTAFARTTKVQLVRLSPSGQRATSIHDLKKIAKDASLDPLLQPDDQITIPE